MIRHIPMPTVQMLQLALRERVLEPGTEFSGFVYFERVPPDKGRGVLRARFPDAGGGRVTRLAIPFETGRGARGRSRR